MTAPVRSAADLLRIEECDAWFDYLAQTQGQPDARYEDREPWAWSRLQQRLRAIEGRRVALA